MIYNNKVIKRNIEENCKILSSKMTFNKVLLLVVFSVCLEFVYSSEDYVVEVVKDKILNVVSDKFVSFSVDPRLLVTYSEIEHSDDCMCMAQSLSPAYIRIAGPSTSSISLDDTNISDHNPLDKRSSVSSTIIKYGENDSVTPETWKIILDWMKLANLTPFIALNDNDKYIGNNWNPMMAIKTLSLADKSKIGECVWQLGYECQQQTSEKHLNTLKALKIIMDTFPSGKKGDWKLVSGDVSQCLGVEKPQKLKSFLLGSNSFLDAAILYSEDSTDILDILKPDDKEMVKEELHKKETQLWKSVKMSSLSEEDEAIAWVKTLGNAAKDGYSVVFKDLSEDDLYKPNFSYYVSFLHKKLVGQKVLDITELTSSEDIFIFGHCTGLSGGPAAGAITLFGANEGKERSTVSINLTVNETAGEILQYLLYKNDNGNISINGKEMMDEDDLQPAIQEVGTFRKLIISLPPKSIGFWIISNANLDICSAEKNNAEVASKVLKHKKLQGDINTDILQKSIQESLKAFNLRKKRSFENTTTEKTNNTANEVVEESRLIIANHSNDFPIDFSKFMHDYELLSDEELCGFDDLENLTDTMSIILISTNNLTGFPNNMKDIMSYLIEELISLIDLEKEYLHKVNTNHTSDLHMLNDLNQLMHLNHSSEGIDSKANEIENALEVEDDKDVPVEDELSPRFIRYARGLKDRKLSTTEEKYEEVPESKEEVEEKVDDSEDKKVLPFKLPKLPKFAVPKVPKQSLEALMSRAKSLKKEIGISDSAKSASHLEPILSPVDEIMHDVKDLKFKTDLEKNKLKLDHLRHKMHKKLTELNLKSRFRNDRAKLELNSDLLSLKKREAKWEEDINKHENKNFEEDSHANFQITKNKRKKYFKNDDIISKKMLKTEHRIDPRKDLPVYDYSDEVMESVEDNVLRKKRFLISENMIDTSDEGTDNNQNSLPSRQLDLRKPKSRFDFKKSMKMGTEKKLPFEKNDATMSNAIVKINATDSDCSRENPTASIENLNDLQQEKITFDDFKEDIGLKQKDPFDQIFGSVSSFFQDAQRKLSDFWDNLKSGH